MADALGVDIVRISRIRDIASRHGERFLSRYFSEAELGYSFKRADPYPHLAARFAAKEAAYKAVCSAGLGQYPLSSFEVVVEGSGVPRMRASSRASSEPERLLLNNTSVSLSHDGDLAIAVVGFSVNGKDGPSMPSPGSAWTC